ncbi:MAG: ribokinase [Oscillibacter sp.]|jgi:ribokinase|nr:ribokinase [Oscillibacter sp.]
MVKKPTILVAGSFVMDLIATASRAPGAGQTVIGRAFHMAPGGKGINQAVQCARLGADVTMVGCVGGDLFGQRMLDTARDARVNVEHVLVDPQTSSGVGHVLLEVTENSAQNRITVIPGANRSLKPADIAWLQTEIRRYDMVMLQMEIPTEVNRQIALWAKAAGVPVMLNPAPAGELDGELLDCADYLTPNEQEAAAETGCPLAAGPDGFSREDLAAAAAVLRAKGARGSVIITLGAQGCAVAEPDSVRQIPAVQMPRVADPTAAGDSFTAALCVGLCVGMTQAQALCFASHTAAITVSRMGAIPSLPSLAEVWELLEQRGCGEVPLSALDALR